MASFVVQEHHSSRLHWDFRLEIGGTLKSWAIPKGPSLCPTQRRLAIQVADHPLAHAHYQGVIPAGRYGAGPVLIWDSGTFNSIEPKDPADGIRDGRLRFRLHGRKLKGSFTLYKLSDIARPDAWLLCKARDEYARATWETPIEMTPERQRRLRVKAPLCAAV